MGPDTNVLITIEMLWKHYEQIMYGDQAGDYAKNTILPHLIPFH